MTLGGPGSREGRGGRYHLAAIVSAACALFLALHFAENDILALARQAAYTARQALQGHRLLCAAGFLGGCAVLINLPAPLAAVLKMASGFIFGEFLGAFLNVAGSGTGAWAGFLVSRRFLWDKGEAVRRLGGEGLRRRIGRDGFWFVLACRLSIVTPFFLVNILAGASGMRLQHFLLATLLGVVPSSLFYAMAGDGLASVSSLSDLVTPRLALAVAGFTGLALFPVFFRISSHPQQPRRKP